MLIKAKWKMLTGKRIPIFVGVLFLQLIFFSSCSKDDIEGPAQDNREPMTILPEPEGMESYEGEAPQYSKVNVFNQELLLPGYAYFRIPALVTTNQGTLVAVAEMRTGGDIDPKTLVARRSTDNGQTWSPLSLVEEQTTTNIYGNQNLVVDRNTGNIHLIYLQIFEGGGSRTCNMYHRISTDDGVTWSERVLVPNVVQASWRPLGPAAGIQLERGEHAGRLLIPGRYIDSERGNYGIYSDDGGVTWQAGYKSSMSGDGAENETTCVELNKLSGSESVVYINSRDEGSSTSSIFRRLEAYSNDSGESLTGVFRRNPVIKTDRCQGDLLRWAATDKGAARNRILFSNVSWAKEAGNISAQSRRRHVGIWSTFDETESWTPFAKRVQDLKGGYSSMTKTEEGYIGILFEEGESNYFSDMSFVTINEAFLDVPVIGAKWDFEEQSPGKNIAEGEKLKDTYKGGTSRDIEVAGDVSATSGSEVFKQNTALSFNGSSYLKLEDIDTWTQFDFNEDQSFSVEILIKARQADAPGFLIGRPYQTSWPQWLLTLEQDGAVSFRIDDDENFALVKTKTSVADDKWHHVAAVRDRAARKIKIYIDGHLSNEVADEVKGSLANRRPLYIGGTGKGNDHFKGEIDYVRITPKALEKFVDRP